MTCLGLMKKWTRIFGITYNLWQMHAVCSFLMFMQSAYIRGKHYIRVIAVLCITSVWLKHSLSGRTLPLCSLFKMHAWHFVSTILKQCPRLYTRIIIFCTDRLSSFWYHKTLLYTSLRRGWLVVPWIPSFQSFVVVVYMWHIAVPHAY